MGKRNVLTDEQKRQICQQFREGARPADIARSFGVSQSTISYTIDKNLSKTACAPLPIPSGCKSALDAFGGYYLCSQSGFDSPQAITYCRSKGIKPSELQEYGEWASLHLDLFDKNINKQYRDDVESLSLKCSQLEEVKQTCNEALAEVAKYVLLHKKDEQQHQQDQFEIKQVRLEKELIKKATAMFKG